MKNKITVAYSPSSRRAFADRPFTVRCGTVVLRSSYEDIEALRLEAFEALVEFGKAEVAKMEQENLLKK